MNNNFLTILLITTLLAITTFGQTTVDNRAEKARQTVAKIGTGSKAKVEVKLRDSTTLKGYVGSVDGDSFSLVDEKSGGSRNIAFSDVDKLKKRGGGLGKGAWIAIAAGAAVVVLVIALRPVFCDGGAGC
ncbi:MAG: hypothetical protein WBD16_13845 [Pyrinomonadaceae bacterium]